MKRHMMGLALLSLLTSDDRGPLVPKAHVPGWWKRMCREMHDLGAYAKGAIPGENDTADVEWAVPPDKLEEARAIIAKYGTPEFRAEMDKAEAELNEVRR